MDWRGGESVGRLRNCLYVVEIIRDIPEPKETSFLSKNLNPADVKERV